MEYANDLYEQVILNLSDDALSLLNVVQINTILETAENIDFQRSFENDINHLVLWSEAPIINRLVRWLSRLNEAKTNASQSYDAIVSAVIWAFINQKPISNQTQGQFLISITELGYVVASSFPIARDEDAQYLLMNIFIYSKRPDLAVRSLRQLIEIYKANKTNYLREYGFEKLINYLFIQKSVPNFMFPYLTIYSNWEFEIIIALLDGKSLRKVLAPRLKISKSENAILQINSIEFYDVSDNILERHIVAASILKYAPKEHYLLKNILLFSKIFQYEFISFKNDLVFWKDVFIFLISNKLHLDEFDDILHSIDFLESQRYYVEEPLVFSLKGRTIESVRRLIDNWNITAKLPPEYLEYSWESLGIEKWTFIRDNESYIIEEITDGKRLQAESKVLEHCVYSYAAMCYKGNTHIFSLSKLKGKTKKPFVTIEVRANEIVQVAGKMNQQPSEKTISIIESWCVENWLNIDKTQFVFLK